jgi:hypothetical protein
MKIPRLTAKTARPAQASRRLIAVDPGTTESAYVEFMLPQRRILRFGKVKNELLLCNILDFKPDAVACERIRSYGMPVGQTTFDTVHLTGRLHQLCLTEEIPVKFLFRTDVKKAFAPLPRRNDRDIRAALLSIYGQQGTRKQPGPTYGITKDVWAALGVAHAYSCLVYATGTKIV